MSREYTYPGQEAVEEKGWLLAHKWLILRRFSQLAVIGLFLTGPMAGIWILKGNLTASTLLDTVPMNDPFMLVQSILAGHWPEITTFIGAAIITVFYAVFGGRAYCAWVCPVNLVTDASASLHQRLDLRKGWQPKRNARYFMLAMVCIVAALGGGLAWEMINPVTIIHRGLVFGMGAGWGILVAIFLFDLFVSHRGWCGHICPMGAFYSLVGKFSLVRVRADKRDACNDCMDCFDVCPENQVISPALRGAKTGHGPVIDAAACTNCGRCIDVCSKDVFHFGLRFEGQDQSAASDIIHSEGVKQ